MPTTPPLDDKGQAPPIRLHGFRARLRDFLAELLGAVNVRGLVLILGVLALQVAFVLSYIGAFHSPRPHKIPVAVAAPSPVAGKTVSRLNGLSGDPLKARSAKSEADARSLILKRTVDAALVIDPMSSTDKLLVASAGGPAVSSAAGELITKVEAARDRQVTTQDIRPPAAGDSRSLSSFYLVIGWMVGGYLAAAALGATRGARPANLHRTVIRLLTLALYAIVSGLAGAVIANPVLGALTGHFMQIWAIGSLVVFAAAASTVAFQAIFGLAGVGVAILLFVDLGNPSANGPYPASLLPAFWSAVGDCLPPGAGTIAVRNTVYFSGNATDGPLGVLAAYALAGTALSLLVSAYHRRRRAEKAVEDRKSTRDPVGALV